MPFVLEELCKNEKLEKSPDCMTHSAPTLFNVEKLVLGQTLWGCEQRQRCRQKFILFLEKLFEKY